MQSAIKLFCSLGFQNTSTTKITKDAKVGTGTLFLYFKSKDELVNALYLKVKREMQVFHEIFFDESLSFREQMRTFWFNTVDWGLKNPLKFKFMMQFKNSPYISKLTKDELYEEQQHVFKVLMQAIEQGVIIDQPIEFLAAVFTGQFTSIIQHLSIQKSDNQEELIAASFEVLWNGIKKI